MPELHIAVNQKLAERLLSRLGYRSQIVANGVEALDAVRSSRFDLVLMDIMMPDMDGYAATRGIRAVETNTRVPIIAMTANVLAGERERCLAAGMDDFLSKPIRSKVLATALQQWIPLRPNTDVVNLS